jgi:hypothetical protein
MIINPTVNAKVPNLANPFDRAVNLSPENPDSIPFKQKITTQPITIANIEYSL